MHNKFFKKNGFTLVELLTTIAIVLILGIIILPNLLNSRNIGNLSLTSNEVLSVARATQARAIDEENGAAWGIRFSNLDSSNPSYQVFSGLSYASGTVDRTYYPQRGIKFASPSAGSYSDVLFSAITGRPSANQTISMVTGRGDGFVNDLIFSVSSGLISTSPEKSVAGYWHLDEATGTAAYDTSGFGRNGTLYSAGAACSNPPTAGCPTWTSGASCRDGNCLSFNGSNDYITAPNLSISNAITVEAWVYSSDYSQNGYVIGQTPSSTQWKLFFEGGFIKWRPGSTMGQINCPAPANNAWHYLAGTLEGVTSTLYIDGVRCMYIFGGSPMSAGGGTVEIGRYNSGYYFNGKIDEVRVYNRALSATEVLNHYNELK